MQQLSSNDRPYEFINPVGVIFNESIIVYKIKNSNAFPLGSVRRIKILKKRMFRWNITLFCMLCIFVFCFYRLNSDRFAQGLFLFFSIVSLLLGILFKKYEYKLIVLSENDFFEMEFHKSLKDDVKLFVAKANKKIKTANKLASA